MLRGEKFVCFGTAEWDAPLPTNQHHLMRRLAENNQVVFVETLGTRSPTAKRTDLKRMSQRLQRGLSPLQQLSERLWVFSPLSLPWHGSGLFRSVNGVLFASRLKGALKRLGFERPIAWLYNAYGVYYLEGLKPGMTVYHCVDDLSLVPGASQVAMRTAQGMLLQRADLVLASSPALHEQCRRFTQECHLLPNVADFEHFSRAQSEQLKVPAELQSLKRPVVMFTGNLTPHKVDLDLIDFLCANRFDWSVVLVGPLWEGLPRLKLEKLRRWKHLFFLPGVPYRDLPQYLKAADALIIPYLTNEVTQTIFPLKFFEYLATGKPVVSAPLPALAKYHELVPMHDTYQGFLNALNRLLKEDTTREQRVALAKQNDWQARMEEISQLIEARRQGTQA